MDWNSDSCQMSSKVGHWGQKLGHLVKSYKTPCVCSRGHIFSPIIMKLGKNVCLNEISDEFGKCVLSGEKLGH